MSDSCSMDSMAPVIDSTQSLIYVVFLITVNSKSNYRVSY